MKTFGKIIFFTVVIASVVFSQQLISSRHEFIGYNIGNSNPFYPQVNEVPDGQSGVTALALGQDGNVYGGTSATNGKSCYLITYKTTSNLVAEFYSLDKTIKGQTKIGRALVSGQDGYIYGGTSIYSDTLFVFGDSARNKSYEGGHLFRFKEGKLSSAEDLGVVLPAEGVRVLTADPKRGRLYGLTEPGYKFFIYDIKAKKLTVRQDVDLAMEKENCYNQLLLVRKGLALAVDKKGCVWGSAYKNKMFKYNPEDDKLEITTFVMPASYGHADRDGLGALITAPDGVMYGGTQADGVLFRFNPETGVMDNLGKPGMPTNIRSLVITPKGKIIGVVGQNELLGQIFTWENGVYELIGWVRTAVMRTDYNWYASDLVPCVYMPTGTVMFGNAGRLGKLISWYNN